MMTIDANCPFCADNKDITIESTDQWRALYNISPIVRGHCLVVPRWHIKSLMDLTGDQTASLFLFATKITKLILRAENTNQFDLAVQEGHAAGQTVAHLHIHIIPRKPGDLETPGAWHEKVTGRPDIDSTNRPRLTHEQMARETQKIKNLAHQHH